jgi:hypothetical protein
LTFAGLRKVETLPVNGKERAVTKPTQKRYLVSQQAIDEPRRRRQQGI